MPVLVLLVLLFAAGPLRADDASDARAHLQKGQTHYALGEFEDAVKEFREAYRLKHEPVLLFNIAQAMRQIRQYQQAYFYYKQYLSQRPEASNREEVEQFIAQMKKKIDAEEAAEKQRKERDALTPGHSNYPEDHLANEAGSGAASAGAAAPGMAAPASAAALPEAARASEPEPPAAAAAHAQPASRLHYAGWALLGAGVLAEGAAFYFHGSAQSAADQFNSHYTGGQLTPSDSQLKQDAQSKGSTATLLLAGGALALVSGALLSFAF